MKNDGTDYEPESFRVMIACLDRHLKEHGATYSILKDRCFEASCKVLEGKAIELRRQGKGKKKMKADVVTKEEGLPGFLSGGGGRGGDLPPLERSVPPLESVRLKSF